MSRYKDFTLAYFGNKCQICGQKGKKFVLHHKDGNQLNNALENWTLLCSSCHNKQHKRLGTNSQKHGEHITTVKELIDRYGSREIITMLKTPQRWQTLEDNIPLSTRTLAKRLKEGTEGGIIERFVDNGNTFYRLSAKGMFDFGEGST